MSQQALAGYRVLDLGQYIAGPFCTKLLAGLGAEVIKVERPDGDPARRVGPFVKDDPNPEKGLLYLYLNTGKKGITLNLKSDTGKKVFKDLVKDADVLVENFRPGVMADLGLDYETLEKINPGLIMTSISSFGQTGPYRDFKASDLTLMSMGGLVHMCGDVSREPITYGGSQAQYQGGTNAFTAIMIALFYKNKSGEGQYIDISMLECIASILEQFDHSFWTSGGVYERSGPRWANISPWGIYHCKDGYIGLVRSASIARWWQFAEMMGKPELKDFKYVAMPSDPRERTLLMDEIDATMYDWLMDHTVDEIYREGQSRGIPCAPVRNIKDLYEWCQMVERGFFVEIDHPVAGKALYPGAMMKMTGTPMETGRAPLLGEHNDEVYYKRLGYSKEDMAKMKENGVI